MINQKLTNQELTNRLVAERAGLKDVYEVAEFECNKHDSYASILEPLMEFYDINEDDKNDFMRQYSAGIPLDDITGYMGECMEAVAAGYYTESTIDEFLYEVIMPQIQERYGDDIEELYNSMYWGLTGKELIDTWLEGSSAFWYVSEYYNCVVW